jgi:predicted phosphoribosyltransferase
MRYKDREDAGRSLGDPIAAVLAERGVTSVPIVLGIPRGGIIVAAPVARRLGGELNVALARKIGAPGNPELALGAVGEGGDTYLMHDLIDDLGVSPAMLAEATEVARGELERRLSVYRKVKAMPALKDRVVVVVDDGVATGATFHATLQTIRTQEPKLLVGAAPVGPIDSTSMLAASADVFVCPHRPRWFRAVGEWYDRFGQVSEEEVIAALS